MNRSLSTVGYLYAIRKLAIHWQEHGIRGDHSSEEVMETLVTLGVEDDRWSDDARSLLIASEALAVIADARGAPPHLGYGQLATRLDYEDLHDEIDRVVDAEGPQYD